MQRHREFITMCAQFLYWHTQFTFFHLIDSLTGINVFQENLKVLIVFLAQTTMYTNSS